MNVFHGYSSCGVSVCVVRQTNGRTPIYVASLNGHVEVVRALVGAGAAVNQAKVRYFLGGCWSVRVCVGGWMWWDRSVSV